MKTASLIFTASLFLKPMKYLPVLIALFISCAPMQAQHAEYAIQNKRNEKYTSVAGTRVYLKVPKDYIASSVFTGIQKNSKTGVSVSDLPGGNYYSTSESFSKTELERLGMKVMEFRELKMNGYPAKYIHASGSNNISEYSIVFGDSTFSTILIGLYPDEDSLSGLEVRDIILTSAYERDRIIDPFETANFKVDEKKSVFKFAKHANGTYTFSLGGVKRTDYGREAFMLFMPVPEDTSKSLRTFSEETVVQMQRYGLVDFEIRNPSSASVNGYPAYECEVAGYLKGEKSFTYILVVKLRAGQLVLIEGIAKNEIENNLAEMKKLSHTIRVK